MNDLMRDNRLHWDELADLHLAADFYDVEGFRRGACSLLPIELRELVDVQGCSMAHLQCHIGLDTISWARRGVRAVGLDFSGRSVEVAQQIAAEVASPARFVQADVLEADEALGDRFDIVFTSWGVLSWVSDLQRWASVVQRLLAPGGRFYIAEVHPMALLFGETPAGGIEPQFNYFSLQEPETIDAEGCYADPSARLKHPLRHEWIFELGQVITVLLKSGLQIEFVHEHPATCFRAIPGLVQGHDRMWRMPSGRPSLPLSFSILARASTAIR